MNKISMIIAYETGELSEKDTLKLFSKLMADKSVWSLQGHYGRTAQSLIDNDLISIEGKVNWKKYNSMVASK